MTARPPDDAGPSAELRLGAAVRWAAGVLAEAGAASPRTDAELLAAHVTGRTRSALNRATLVGESVSAPELAALGDLVARRTAGEPVQHLTGTTQFRRVQLTVGPGAFIPRPETELLAGWAAQATRAAGPPDGRGVTVLDLGTGSGAIAAAVADEVPGARVLAVEVDPDAAAWARRNLSPTTVQLIEGDGTLLDTTRPELVGRIDVLVSNPPYIPLEQWESVPVEVRDHDPGAALWGGHDGLQVIRALIRVAARLLRPGGALGIEHADLQGEAVPALLAAAGCFGAVRDHRDLAGRPRFTTAVFAPAGGSPPAWPASARMQP